MSTFQSLSNGKELIGYQKLTFWLRKGVARRVRWWMGQRIAGRHRQQAIMTSARGVQPGSSEGDHPCRRNPLVG